MNQTTRSSPLKISFPVAAPGGKKLLRPLDAQIGQGIQALASLSHRFQNPDANATELKEPVLSLSFSQYLTVSHSISRSWSLATRQSFVWQKKCRPKGLNWNLLITDLAQVLQAALVEVQLRLVFCGRGRWVLNRASNFVWSMVVPLPPQPGACSTSAQIARLRPGRLLTSSPRRMRPTLLVRPLAASWHLWP